MNHSLKQALSHAHHLFQSKRIDEAIKQCKEIIKQYPKQSEPCILLAQIENQRGQHESAIRALEKASKRKPKDRDVFLMQGDLHIQLQQAAKAEKAYQSALRLTPQDDTVKTRLAAALQLQKTKIDKAIALYKDVVNNQPFSADAHYNLGTAFKRKHQFIEAIAAYRKSVEFSPNDSELRLNLSNLLFETGYFEDAADELATSNKLKPNNPTVLYQLSYVNKRLKRPQAALEAAEQLVTMQPSSQALSTLAAAKLMNSNYESALIDCDLGLSKRPEDRRLLSDKTIALSGKGDKSAANDLFKLDELLAISNIDTPEGYDTIADFNQQLTQHIDEHKGLDFSGVSHSCQKGNTSKDVVFVSPSGPFKLLSDAIRSAVAAYHRNIDQQSSHPWLQHIPEFSELTISGWVTKLGNQGHQEGHIHDTAWISGVYYVNLPTNRGNQAGSIEFGRAPFFYPEGDQGSIKVIEPLGGSLVLFPSYFYHRTIPFESEQDRITIAFDFRTDDFA
ncbi:MAG: hypothetical protein ACJAUP_002903 [Cellvibrionaceae bacterium]|jgi:uncharacterized protein (TIGR02466 family)